MRILTLNNLMFLLFDVCFTAWDFISDLMVLGVYWSNAQFGWVRYIIIQEIIRGEVRQ